MEKKLKRKKRKMLKKVRVQFNHNKYQCHLTPTYPEDVLAVTTEVFRSDVRDEFFNFIMSKMALTPTPF